MTTRDATDRNEVRPVLSWKIVQAISGSGPMDWVMGHATMLRHLPQLPRFVTGRLGTEPPRTPRSLEVPEVPQELRSEQILPLNQKAATVAFQEAGPLPVWTKLHHEVPTFLRAKMWEAFLLGLPGMTRAQHRLAREPVEPASPAGPTNQASLTQDVKDKARELGISAVGVAAFDERWVYEPYQSDHDGDKVIICVVEQNWAATQTVPSPKAERAAVNAYGRGIPMTTDLAAYIRSRGFKARAGDHAGRMMAIPFAIEAGLGQLGMNGQLLTPFAGSRCRLFAITTDAPLVLDKAVDFGVPAICNECQVCVKNCPSGAIPNQRHEFRGVTKAKIKTERCIPMMAASAGCAVCMKVCPVQRYGLPAVIDEYKRSGTILGKGTDELEGYDWPVDGRRYGPGEKPRHAVSQRFLRPEGMIFDPNRKTSTLSAREQAELDQRIATGAEVDI